MNGNYLIPANTSRGKLLFGIFRPVDFAIFATGVGLTLILLLVVPIETTTATIIVLLPGMIGAALTAPIPHYHNVMTVLIETYEFFTQRQRYIWKGWCYKDGDKTSIK